MAFPTIERNLNENIVPIRNSPHIAKVKTTNYLKTPGQFTSFNILFPDPADYADLYEYFDPMFTFKVNGVAYDFRVVLEGFHPEEGISRFQNGGVGLPFGTYAEKYLDQFLSIIALRSAFNITLVDTAGIFPVNILFTAKQDTTVVTDYFFFGEAGAVTPGSPAIYEDAFLMNMDLHAVNIGPEPLLIALPWHRIENLYAYPNSLGKCYFHLDQLIYKYITAKALQSIREIFPKLLSDENIEVWPSFANNKFDYFFYKIKLEFWETFGNPTKDYRTQTEFFYALAGGVSMTCLSDFSVANFVNKILTNRPKFRAQPRAFNDFIYILLSEENPIKGYIKAYDGEELLGEYGVINSATITENLNRKYRIEQLATGFHFWSILRDIEEGGETVTHYTIAIKNEEEEIIEEYIVFLNDEKPNYSLPVSQLKELGASEEYN